jgi:HEPN domain-containing protein
MKKNIEEWIGIARKDWKRMRRSLKARDAEASGFFLQQSLEKYLKAFLLKHRWNLRKIHELDTLLDDAAQYNPNLERFRDLCERVSGYYFADRYPPLGVLELTCEDIKRDLKEVKKFIVTMFPDEKLDAKKQQP